MWSSIFKGQGGKQESAGSIKDGTFVHRGEHIRASFEKGVFRLDNASSGAMFAQAEIGNPASIKFIIDELNLPHVDVAEKKKRQQKATDAAAAAAAPKRKAEGEPEDQPTKKKAKKSTDDAPPPAEKKVKRGERKPDETEEEYQKRIEKNRLALEARRRKKEAEKAANPAGDAAAVESSLSE